MLVDAQMFDSIYSSVYEGLNKNQFPAFVRSAAAQPHLQTVRKLKADRKAQEKEAEAVAQAKKKCTPSLPPPSVPSSSMFCELMSACFDLQPDNTTADAELKAPPLNTSAASASAAASGAASPTAATGNRRDSQISVALPSFLVRSSILLFTLFPFSLLRQILLFFDDSKRAYI
jgi:hypothetical protein